VEEKLGLRETVMVKNVINRFEELFDSPKSLSVSDFEQYIIEYLERKGDQKLAIQELDKLLAILQNHILSLSLFLKQTHLLNNTITAAPKEVEYYTKQEVAVKYRVSVRTVTNWIIDGLEAVEIGGVKRISNAALLAFSKIKKTKKFNWKSFRRIT
jgi:hypothetical protein